MTNGNQIAIQLHGQGGGQFKFEWASYKKSHRVWLNEHHGRVFKAIRSGLNTYDLGNGITCHIYDAAERQDLIDTAEVATEFIEPVPDYLADNKLMMVKFLMIGGDCGRNHTREIYVGPVTKMQSIVASITTEVYSVSLKDRIFTGPNGVDIRISIEDLDNDPTLVTEARVAVERAMRNLKFMVIDQINSTEIFIRT